MEGIDFGIKTYVKLFEVNGTPIGITTTHISTWIVAGVLIVLAMVIRVKIKNFKEVPESKLQNIVEVLVDSFGSFTAGTMGEKNKKFSLFYGPMFLFILFSNLSGLFGLRPPTADFATTLALALTTFFMIHGFGIKTKGLGYFKEFLEPLPILLPLNIIGELAIIISLSFRLFGNILGGTIIMMLYYGMLPIFLKIGIPAVFHLYFDVFESVLQSLIFVILSMNFVSRGLE